MYIEWLTIFLKSVLVLSWYAPVLASFFQASFPEYILFGWIECQYWMQLYSFTSTRFTSWRVTCVPVPKLKSWLTYRYPKLICAVSKRACLMPHQHKKAMLIVESFSHKHHYFYKPYLAREPRRNPSNRRLLFMKTKPKIKKPIKPISWLLSVSILAYRQPIIAHKQALV